MQTIKKPDFTCIGPTKTGTTWLFGMLSKHPEVWLPPFKEIRYLNEGNVVPAHSLMRLLFSSHWHFKIMRRNLVRNFRGLARLRTWKPARFENPWWFFRYCFGRRSYDWYSGLFPAEAGLLSGDISPNYYEIPTEKIEELSRFNPSIKILMLLRNPVERVWSLASMVMLKDQHRSIGEVRPKEFIAYFDRVYARWTPYREAIRRWTSHFQDVFVGRYDHLDKNPQDFFRQVTDFLEIAPDRVPQSYLQRRVNLGLGEPLPEELQRYLEDQYASERMDLTGHFEHRLPPKE
jgi:hypothetical protein